MKVVFFVMSLLTSSVCLAQYDPLGAITFWTDGYVVTQENDTIQGQVRIGSLVNDSPHSVVVKTTDNKKLNLKGNQLKIVAQQIPDYAYVTGSIPRERKMIIFERIESPREKNKPVLVERLSRPTGKIALYFDRAGYKLSREITFGNFTISTDRNERSYIVLKDGQTSIVKKGTLDESHDNLFGDCPLFLKAHPISTRKDWRNFGDMVNAYNEVCVVGPN